MAMPFLWANELVSFCKLSPRNKNAQREFWIFLKRNQQLNLNISLRINDESCFH